MAPATTVGFDSHHILWLPAFCSYLSFCFGSVAASSTEPCISQLTWHTVTGSTLGKRLFCKNMKCWVMAWIWSSSSAPSILLSPAASPLVSSLSICIPSLLQGLSQGWAKSPSDTSWLQDSTRNDYILKNSHKMAAGEPCLTCFHLAPLPASSCLNPHGFPPTFSNLQCILQLTGTCAVHSLCIPPLCSEEFCSGQEFKGALFPVP